jgi:protein-tyrosine-phosphatase
MTQAILFLCPHSAAKSVLAAAYFQRLAGQRQLDVSAAFAGTEPDAAISPAVAELLHSEGIDVTGYMPRRVTAEELAQAWRVISLGCEVDHLAPSQLAVERWDDVPPPSQDLAAAKNIILARVEQLVTELKFLESSNSL